MLQKQRLHERYYFHSVYIAMQKVLYTLCFSGHLYPLTNSQSHDPRFWCVLGLPVCANKLSEHCSIWVSLPSLFHLHYLSLNRKVHWGTTDDLATSFLHFPLFSTALWDLANSRPAHPWCCLPTPSSVCLVFFPLSLCLARCWQSCKASPCTDIQIPDWTLKLHEVLQQMKRAGIIITGNNGLPKRCE